MSVTQESPATADSVVDELDWPATRLRVQNLSTAFRIDGAVRQVVSGVSFDLLPGQCVAIVGESGSGKSVTARSIVGLAGRNALVDADVLEIHHEDVRSFTPRQWRRIRGRDIGFVLQDALVSLDPLRPVGQEIAEALRLHGWGDRAARKQRVLDLLERVGVPFPAVRARQRPDQLSGGLRQRALIASAIALDPDIVIADEPTTALDVTVQSQVLAQLERMKARGASVILISHDLSVVARLADHILVMRGGEVLEQGSIASVLGSPQHEYTKALIAAVPSEATRGTPLSPASPPFPEVRDAVAGAAQDAPVPEAPVLQATELVKRFHTADGTVTRAVDGVSFALAAGETLGIVGESGSGKSTTARLALGLESLDGGDVRLLGQAWSSLSERKRRTLRPRISVVYQDPLSSFDPRWNVERILLDALRGERFADAAARKARVVELLRQVGLTADVLGRFPLRLSGGQRQRVAIARALAPRPAVIVLDEAVSALDVTIQAQILDLLVALQRESGVAYLFISHDLGVISHLSDRVLVMKDGVVVEQGKPDDIFLRPQHPYTRDLIAAIPEFDPASFTGRQNDSARVAQEGA
ncbi:ABC transporter ATP-binding protein [Leifsonia sp. PS1209]|uniref:dipeptide ABC transporter ATP-binding protein n=1 Tax=Leifsonia sp. PS1209 TaxID=2724914 RepID=UPI001442A60E|nr:ABC transporter ATP-binding protein [Leifsonia sp. PS1209]QIZ97859.1 ABC transporter ATP-binding protein [Leifsonia sp. PS1209]